MKCILIYLTFLILNWVFGSQVKALPRDKPEEVLRTEIILEGRSPINGKPLSAEEYITIQDQIAQNNVPVKLQPKIKELIFLLRLRRAFKTLFPF